MEAIARLVSESLARHGLDRPVDPRRLQWSRWFRCDSPHSLLVVPSKPGIFAIAEEVAAFCGVSEPRSRNPERSHAVPGEIPSAMSKDREGHDFSRAEKGLYSSAALAAGGTLGGAALQRCDSAPSLKAALAAEATPKRMLAVLQFSEDDDMAFTLDRMFTRENPMRARLASGRCSLRFVVIEDQAQRRSICAALNQWMVSSAEKAPGLPAEFLSSLELAPIRVGRTLPSTGSRQALSGNASGTTNATPAPSNGPAVTSDSGANANLHCPHPLPSGF